MKITTSVQGDTTILTITGEFTGEFVPRFREAVRSGLDAGRRDVLVDLSATRCLDSRALEALTALQRQTTEQLGMLRLCVTDAALRTVFAITRLDQQLTIDETRDAALEGFGGGLILDSGRIRTSHAHLPDEHDVFQPEPATQASPNTGGRHP